MFELHGGVYSERLAGSIDSFDGEHISGWANGDSRSGCYSLYLGSTFIMDICTDIVRSDVNASLGINGEFGFVANIANVEYNAPEALFVLKEKDSDAIIAWRLFHLACALPRDKAIVLALTLATAQTTLADALRMITCLADRHVLDPARFMEIAGAVGGQICPGFWLEAARVCEAKREFDSAEQFYRQAFSLVEIQGVQKHIDLTIDDNNPGHNLYRFLLSRMVKYKIKPNNKSCAIWVLHMFKKLTSIFSDTTIKFCFFNFIRNYITGDTTKVEGGNVDIFRDRIALLL